MTDTGQTGALSRERIARAALALADREGLERVTMRRLARELGVGTMTLYGYFRDKEELVDAAVELASAEHPASLGRGSWREQLRELMNGVRRALEAHPSGLRARLDRPLLTPQALRVTEAALEVLIGAGFTREEAARAYRTLFIYTFGFVAFSSPGDPEGVRRQTRAAIAGLPAEEYPELTRSIDEAAEAMAGDAQFEYGLERLLDGLEASLRA
jgi:AcrR family transcriptional regulator